MMMKRVMWGVLALSSVSAPAWAQEEAPASASEAATAAAEPEPEAPPARGPHTAGAIQLGVGFRYGAELNDGDFNPWGPGIGLSAGYTLPMALYLGGNFEYFFGDSVEAGGVKVKGNVWQLTAEGGYDVGLGENFVIRPKVGFGIAGLKTSVEGCPAGLSCSGSSETKPVLAPGATFMLFTSHVSLSLDARYAMIFTDDETGKALIFSFGIGF
jgi:opacity protein-like surface antigen